MYRAEEKVLLSSTLIVALLLGCRFGREVLQGEYFPYYCLISILVVVWVGWAGLADGISDLIAQSDRRGSVRLLVRVAVAVVLVAFSARILIPQSPEWFGSFGDYINPVLTSITLVVLASALGFQRMELESAKKNLAISESQLRSAEAAERMRDAAVLVVREVHTDDGYPRVELECDGHAPGVNVELLVRGASEEAAGKVVSPSGSVQKGPPREGEVVMRGRVGVAPRGKVFTVRLKRVTELPAEGLRTIAVEVKWESMHGATLSYVTTLSRDGHDKWVLPERIKFLNPGLRPIQLAYTSSED